MFIEIPAVICAAVAEILIRTDRTGFIFITEIFPEYLKLIFPDIFEIIFQDVALYEFRTAFNIQTGDNIAVRCNTRCVDSGHTEKIPVTDVPFVFES